MNRLVLLSALFLVVIGCGERERPAAETATVASSTVATESVATESVATTATTATTETTADPNADVTGSYFAMARLPAEFAELDHLLLATIDENAAPAPLNGFLRPKAARAKDYTLVNPVLSGKALTFTTIEVAGVHYAFTGTFAVLAHFAAEPPDYETAVLTGTLTKMRGTQQVASTPVKFRYEAGG